MTEGGKNYRLPGDVHVRRYAPVLRIDLEADRFEGQMELEVELSSSQREIRLHAVDLDLTEAVVGAQTAQISEDEESETVGLRFAEPLPAGISSLCVRWTGAFCDGLRGLYRAGLIAVTQFEAADARRVFPCLDEPGFKARWALELRDVPPGITAISNGAVVRDERDARTGLRTIQFADTPPMSSYLVAMVLGELESGPSEEVVGVLTRTWAVPDKRALTGFGQMCARESLPRLQEYFGLPYIFGKLDQIGIPDFEAGAMENSGCITYRETALLLDPETAPFRVKKIVAEIVTHELAHQWFGNLVTMVWWDDLWLNEAFATWMAYKIVDQWAPEWHMWMDFEVGKQAAFSLDALVSSHPIHSEVQNAEQAGEAFDAITYEKGGAVLRMIEGYIGEDPFRRGIARYMSRHREANATGNDLWAALSESSRAPVGELANDWIHRTGFPVVDVDLVDDVAHVSQRRFLSDPGASDEDPCWIIPLVFRYADDAGVRTHRVLQRDRSVRVELPHQGRVQWCIANADGRGFFRTAYASHPYRAVLENLDALSTGERMGLVSDVWALMKRGEKSAGDVLDLTERLSGERDHVVLDQLVSCLAALEYRHVADADQDRFRSRVTEVFRSAQEEFGWVPATREGDRRRLSRAAVLRAMVAVARDPDGVAVVRERFAELLGSGSGPALDPNLLDLVVTVGARTADCGAFEALRERARTTVDPVSCRRYLHALARVEDPKLAKRAVEISFTDEVPLQDYAAFTAGLLRNPVAREMVWGRLRDDFTPARERLSAPMIRTRFVESLAALVTAIHLEQVHAFLDQEPLEGTTQARQQTLERLRLDVALRARVAPEVAAWLVAPST